jgi:hypothetical protein
MTELINSYDDYDKAKWMASGMQFYLDVEIEFEQTG